MNVQVRVVAPSFLSLPASNETGATKSYGCGLLTLA
jgi:hypothetical protein